MAVSLSDSPFSTAEPLAFRPQGVGGEALGGQVEARRGARGRLPEEVDDGAAAKRRHLLDVALQHGQEALGGVEQQLDVGAARGPRC